MSGLIRLSPDSVRTVQITKIICFVKVFCNCMRFLRTGSGLGSGRRHPPSPIKIKWKRRKHVRTPFGLVKFLKGKSTGWIVNWRRIVHRRDIVLGPRVSNGTFVRMAQYIFKVVSSSSKEALGKKKTKNIRKLLTSQKL